MISKKILEFVSYFIVKVLGFTNLPVNPVAAPFVIIWDNILSCIRNAVGYLTWLFPNEIVYQFLIGLTVDLITATLVFEIVSLWLRVYRAVKH